MQFDSLRLLRTNRRLRWFGLGLLASRVGDVFNSIALAWLTLTIGNPGDLGLVLLCAGLPRMLASPIAGYLLDRRDPKMLLIFDNICRAFTVATIPALGWLHLIGVWSLCLIGGLAGLLSTLTDVGENLVTPSLVADAQLDAASAILSLTYEVSALVGPAAAGLCVAVIGYEAAFVCDALSFGVMALAAATLPSLQATASPVSGGTGPLRMLINGFQAAIRIRIVVAMTILSFIFMLVTGMMEVTWPAYSKLVLHTSAWGFGVLMAATGLGATAGVIVITGGLARIPVRAALALVLAAHAVFLAPLVLARSFPVALICAFTAYFVGMPFYTLDRLVVQRATTPEIRGKVFGARQAVTAGGLPLGAAIAGLLVARFGPAALFGGAALVLLAISAIVWIASPFREVAGERDAARHPVSSRAK